MRLAPRIGAGADQHFAVLGDALPPHPVQVVALDVIGAQRAQVHEVLRLLHELGVDLLGGGAGAAASLQCGVQSVVGKKGELALHAGRR